MIDGILKFVTALIRPGSTPFLIVFTVVLTILALTVLVLVIGWGKDERFNKAWHVATLWIHLKGGEKDPSKTAEEPGATKPRAADYRKLLYVTVLHLNNRNAPGAVPAYTRIVDRLSAGERAVPVYDEAVYYTLRLFANERSLPLDSDKSREGVVDGRLVFPWTPTVANPFSADDPHTLAYKSALPSDTMLSVSHFLNGLQQGNHTFCTYADQDADSLRIVVDFSAIPNASSVVSFDNYDLCQGEVTVTTSNVHYEKSGNIYTAECTGAKEGQLLRLHFRIQGFGSPS